MKLGCKVDAIKRLAILLNFHDIFCLSIIGRMRSALILEVAEGVNFGDCIWHRIDGKGVRQ